MSARVAVVKVLAGTEVQQAEWEEVEVLEGDPVQLSCSVQTDPVLQESLQRDWSWRPAAGGETRQIQGEEFGCNTIDDPLGSPCSE